MPRLCELYPSICLTTEEKARTTSVWVFYKIKSVRNTQLYIQRKKDQKKMKEYDKRESHINSKIHVICISSNNVRHPVAKAITTLHLTSPNYTSL